LRLRRHAQVADGDIDPAEEYEPLVIGRDELRRLSRTFASPAWLRDLGRTSWLLLGLVLLIVGIVWLLAVTATIVEPVLVGLVIATVASPIVSVLVRHSVPRVLAAGIVLLGFIALGVVIAVLVIGGITSQTDAISDYANSAADKAQRWLEDAGVSSTGASAANQALKEDVPDVLSTLTRGLREGIKGLTSLAFFISFTLFSLFFLLKDGPSMRRWLDRHLGVPLPVAQTITGDVIHAMRRYFTGVTIVAAFNGVVVGVGALALDVPLAGTIAVVTAVTAYIPFIGAFVAGAFAVVIALGAQGTATAAIMLVIVLLANGALQNVVQPIAFGATLKLNPLLILVVTIGAGSIFGGIGMVLAAPLTSAGVQISGDLARARMAAAVVDEPDAPVS
jgi:predicted PurR-regulated permease PerM